MKSVRWLMVLPLIAVLCGCATKGRLALVDIDLREPQQITEYRYEAGVPYNQGDVIVDGEPPAETESQGLAADVWERFMDVLKVIKGRIRIGSLEWDDRSGAE
jgi:predicted small lipoprotein YifL